MKYDITQENIQGHELIGLDAEITNSSDLSKKGVKGRIMFETKNTFEIKTEKGVKKFPKKNSDFRFKLPDKTAVIVEGKELIGKPEDRTKLWLKRIKG